MREMGIHEQRPKKIENLLLDYANLHKTADEDDKYEL